MSSSRSQNPWFSKNQSARKPAKPNLKNDTVNSKFKEAQEKLQAAVKKHIDNYESSSEEEDDGNVNSTVVLGSIFKNYVEEEGSGDGSTKTQFYLQDNFLSGVTTCLICISSVKKTESVWNCTECYCVFHLMCIQRWSKDTIAQQKLALEDRIQVRRIKLSWGCPKCRHEHDPSDIPKEYKCFCTKTTNPVYQPLLVPHSCGDLCRKPLKPTCGHTCTLLCHPGPCPPCPKTVNITCYCASKPPATQRCSRKEWSCGGSCNKLLLCGKHKCVEACHAGDCPPCPKKSMQKCVCNSSLKLRNCTEPVWKCDKVCNKPLGCGHHKCQEVCHAGDCIPCLLSEPRTCPCGKTGFTLPCTEDTPNCGDTCGKLLECGLHVCHQRCHKDKCGLCLDTVLKACRCGLHQKEVQCHKTYFCDTKCKNIKDCNKHPCNRKCCDGNCPPCEKPCSRTLKCGNHKCSSICHQGPCYPCNLTEKVSCRCGSSTITVPCGRKNRTRPPKCNEPCRLPSNCHHEKIQKHNCHFGDCPPCRLICNKALPNCHHKCRVVCHSAVAVKTEGQKATLPWEQIDPQIEIKELPCPACPIPVPVACLGGHEVCDWLCHLSKPSSCERSCGRQLLCGNHSCNLKCHVVEDAPNDVQAGKNCEVCQSLCTKSRPEGCTHKCLKLCHPGACADCKQMIRIKCHCGLTEPYVACKDWNSSENREVLQSCGNQCPKFYPCGHRCRSNCHSGECLNAEQCKKKVKVTCGCKRIKKDFSCETVRKHLAVVECDDGCLQKREELKKEKEMECERKKREEELRNQKELEMFQRKFMGKKKTKEKKIVNVKETNFFQQYKVFIMSTTLLLVAAILIIFVR